MAMNAGLKAYIANKGGKASKIKGLPKMTKGEKCPLCGMVKK